MRRTFNFYEDEESLDDREIQQQLLSKQNLKKCTEIGFLNMNKDDKQSMRVMDKQKCYVNRCLVNGWNSFSEKELDDMGDVLRPSIQSQCNKPNLGVGVNARRLKLMGHQLFSKCSKGLLVTSDELRKRADKLRKTYNVDLSVDEMQVLCALHKKDTEMMTESQLRILDRPSSLLNLQDNLQDSFEDINQTFLPSDVFDLALQYATDTDPQYLPKPRPKYLDEVTYDKTSIIARKASKIVEHYIEDLVNVLIKPSRDALRQCIKQTKVVIFGIPPDYPLISSLVMAQIYTLLLDKISHGSLSSHQLVEYSSEVKPLTAEQRQQYNQSKQTLQRWVTQRSNLSASEQVLPEKYANDVANLMYPTCEKALKSVLQSGLYQVSMSLTLPPISFIASQIYNRLLHKLSNDAFETGTLAPYTDEDSPALKKLEEFEMVRSKQILKELNQKVMKPVSLTPQIKKELMDFLHSNDSSNMKLGIISNLQAVAICSLIKLRQMEHLLIPGNPTLNLAICIVKFLSDELQLDVNFLYTSYWDEEDQKMMKVAWKMLLQYLQTLPNEQALAIQHTLNHLEPRKMDVQRLKNLGKWNESSNAQAIVRQGQSLLDKFHIAATLDSTTIQDMYNLTELEIAERQRRVDFD